MKRFIEKYRVLLLILVLTSLRLFHFETSIDKPHAWRQADTKQYIDSYYQDNVPFLEPSVCWMGGHETLILEFPLPEFMIAQLYHLFGENLLIARAFFLFFFALSLYYLYKTLKLLFNNWTPEIAITIFGLAPLSIFYSRAIHIDFFAIAFSFGMLFHLMNAIQSKSNWHFIWSLLYGCIAFLVKAPYAFFLAIPILVYAIQLKNFKWLFIRSFLFAIPIVLLFLWNKYSFEVNSKIPDWDQIPNFNKFNDMWYWYFGNMDQRLTWSKWMTIFSRIFNEITGYTGLLLLGVGILIGKKEKAYLWSLTFLLSTLIYLAIFFNLNEIHNYYQIPFIAPLAVFIAVGIQKIHDWLPKWYLAPLLLIAFAYEQINYAESNYFKKNDAFDLVSQLIRVHSEKDDLIIVAYGGLTPQCPLVLNPAQRKGWSIPASELTPELSYYLYKNGGADKIAIVYGGYFEGAFKNFFEDMENKIGIPLDDKGMVLYMCDLKFQEPE